VAKGRRKKARRTAAAVNFTTLPPKGDAAQSMHVVIETPKGSRNKYAFKPEARVFELKKVLPAGMAFPYDFGFVPSTLADDGDPVDVLVLMDEPAFAGCLLTCRPIGIIEARQRDEDGWVQNDRIIAVESNNHTFASIHTLNDLGKDFVKELEEFFVNYHDLDDEIFEIIGAKGPDAARKAVARGTQKARRR